MLNLTTDKFATESIPRATPGTPAIPDGITVGPNNQNIWFTDNLGPAVDLKLLATQLVVTTPPQSTTVAAGATISLSVTAEDGFEQRRPRLQW